MTRTAAAQRLLGLRKLRDAEEACVMGAAALIDQPFLLACAGGIGLIAGALIGVLVGVLLL